MNFFEKILLATGIPNILVSVSLFYFEKFIFPFEDTSEKWTYAFVLVLILLLAYIIILKSKKQIQNFRILNVVFSFVVAAAIFITYAIVLNNQIEHKDDPVLKPMFGQEKYKNYLEQNGYADLEQGIKRHGRDLIADEIEKRFKKEMFYTRTTLFILYTLSFIAVALFLMVFVIKTAGGESNKDDQKPDKVLSQPITSITINNTNSNQNRID